MPVDSILSQLNQPTAILAFFIFKIHLTISDNIYKDIEELYCEDMDGIEMAYDRLH